MKLNTKLLFTLIRIQSRMRGLIMRKKVKGAFIDPSINNNNFSVKGKFTFTNNNKIVYFYFLTLNFSVIS